MHDVEPRYVSASHGKSTASLLSCKASVSSVFPHWRWLAEGPSLPQCGPSQDAHCRTGDRTYPVTHLAPGELRQLLTPSRAGLQHISLWHVTEPALHHFHFQGRQRQNSSIMLHVRQTAAHSEFKFCQGGKCLHTSTLKCITYTHTHTHIKDTYIHTHIYTFYICIIGRW